MADGSRKLKKYKNRRYINYTFSTHSFPFENQSRLVQALRDNFSIHANIQKDRSNYIFDQNPGTVLSILFARIFIRALTTKFKTVLGSGRNRRGTEGTSVEGHSLSTLVACLHTRL